jgi:peptidyl-prolyl cis-trans isomerase A (cyclophilin A)
MVVHSSRNSRKQKKAAEAARRLVRTILGACGLFIVSVLLFQMDFFLKHTAKHRNRKRQAPHPNFPDTIQQQQQQLRSNDNNSESNTSRKSDEQKGDSIVASEDTSNTPKAPSAGIVRLEDAGDADIIAASVPRPPRRRVAFELHNLRGDPSTGTIVVETVRDWAPLGVDHFWKLIGNRSSSTANDDAFYQGCRMFRVVPHFVAQFGISGDPAIQSRWRGDVILDDPVVAGNRRGTLTYAMSGRNTRTTQLFFNLNDNLYLDREGFAAIGYAVEGAELLDRIQDMYREQPNQNRIQKLGNAYLEAEFPQLTYIASVREVLD